MVVQRSLLFVTCAEFEKQHGVHPSKAPELTVDDIMDENGSTIRGVVLPDQQNPSRRIIIERRLGTRLQQGLLAGGDQIRPEQGSRMRDVCHADQMQSRPRAMKSQPPSLQQLEDWVAKAKDNAPAEAQEQQEQPPEAPLSSLAVGGEEPDEEDQVQDQTASAAFQHFRAGQKQKGKGKGQGKGGKKRPQLLAKESGATNQHSSHQQQQQQSGSSRSFA